MSDLNVIKFSPDGPGEGLSRWPEIPAEELAKLHRILFEEAD